MALQFNQRQFEKFKLDDLSDLILIVGSSGNLISEYLLKQK